MNLEGVGKEKKEIFIGAFSFLTAISSAIQTLICLLKRVTYIVKSRLRQIFQATGDDAAQLLI